MKTETLTVEQFREEVQDKLSVVFNGCNGLMLQRCIARTQCEDFLVARYAEALGAPSHADAPPTKEHEEASRVGGVPGVGHGDLPRENRNEVA